MQLIIKPLTGVSIEDIYNAFIKAFSDYVEPYDKTLEEVTHMLSRRGYDPSISFGAFAGDELVSFTLNGSGIWDGKLTAYDTGTGTIKEYRQQGLASGIFQATLAALQAQGIQQYLLEVIKVNTAAIDLYKKAGFETVRELDYYIAPVSEIQIKAMLPENCILKEVANPDWQLFSSFWEMQPAWQNSIDSINRMSSHYYIVAAYYNDDIVGYGIIESATGDIPQLAVAATHRRKGVGSALLQSLMVYAQIPVVRIINSDAAYQPFRLFLAKANMHPGHGQYEMIYRL